MKAKTDKPADLAPLNPPQQKVILLSREHDITGFASTDSSRYVINSVHYNAEEKCVEATNGMQLVRVPVEVSEEFPTITGPVSLPQDCILPIDPLKKALHEAPKHRSLNIINHVALTNPNTDPAKNGVVRLTTNDLDTERSAVTKTIEGNYPNMAQVIPTDKPAFSVSLSAHQLSVIVDYVKKHGKITGGDNAAITFEFGKESFDPVRWSTTTNENRKVMGVLMPMRLA